MYNYMSAIVVKLRMRGPPGGSVVSALPVYDQIASATEETLERFCFDCGKKRRWNGAQTVLTQQNCWKSKGLFF